jgi:ribonuclease HI
VTARNSRSATGSPGHSEAPGGCGGHVGAAAITVYTDGACSGNPGPGGFAAIIVEDGVERVISGAEPHTTNQRMELRGAIEALASIPDRRQVHVYTDSAYVMNCFRDGWWEKWEKNGWLGAGKKPVTNRDLWERLIAETRRHDVVWHKVRGHSGDVMNERVDALARGAIATLNPRG